MDASYLAASIMAMTKQTEDSVNLNLRAAFVIVPPELMFTVDVLLNSAAYNFGGDTEVSMGNKNPLLGLGIQTIVENRISAAGCTDPVSGTAATGTATNWFLAASPSQAPTIEVGYVRGTGRAPTMRSKPFDGEGRYGIGWDVKLDIGAKALDHRGLYKHNGA